MDRHALHKRFQEFVRYAEMRHLAYNVAALQRDKMFHSLAVLSFFPAEGKTLLCAALAMAYAEASRTKVLVVDTTTFQNKNSLFLKECFNGSAPDVEVRSLEELRQTLPASPPAPSSLRGRAAPILESNITHDELPPLRPARENDASIIKQAAEDRSKGYGLVLL